MLGRNNKSDIIFIRLLIMIYFYNVALHEVSSASFDDIITKHDDVFLIQKVVTVHNIVTSILVLVYVFYGRTHVQLHRCGITRTVRVKAKAATIRD